MIETHNEVPRIRVEPNSDEKLKALVSPTTPTQWSSLRNAEEVMAFVNEFVSEEDIRKHDLDALWGQRKGWDKGRPLGFQHAWTVNRESGIWFIPFDTGREEFSNRRTCFFNIDDQLFEVTIELAKGSTGRLDAVPFKQVWNLIRIRPDVTDPRKQRLIAALKEALKTYGYEGAKGQVPNTVVEFNF